MLTHAQLIELQFGKLSEFGSGNRVLDGGPNPSRRRGVLGILGIHWLVLVLLIIILLNFKQFRSLLDFTILFSSSVRKIYDISNPTVCQKETFSIGLY